MTDKDPVRGMLRKTLASRRVNDPAATYTPSGALLCNVCRIPVKSEPLWDSHIRSPEHLQHAKAAKSRSSRKRKAETEVEEFIDDDGGRKRAKDVRALPGNFFDASKSPQPPREISATNTDSQRTRQSNLPDQVTTAGLPASLPTNFFDPSAAKNPLSETTINTSRDATHPPPVNPSDVEFAAFEAEIAAIPDEPDGLTALTAPAHITAPASNGLESTTPDEFVDQSQAARLADIEAEREEAARQLEAEFEEMAELEERVRRLRERREAVRLETLNRLQDRSGAPEEDTAGAAAASVAAGVGGGGGGEEMGSNGIEDHDVNDSDSDDSDDNWDDWARGYGKTILG
ncbi:MAG: hypothetical protein M1825_000010 [Sarcosagium campestre]|nr:MAG: hypothetical protein M1825_000010 [Sarcosagium campestre]